MMKSNLLEFTQPELTDFMADLGEKPFRAKQVWQWIWQKGVVDFEAMTNLSKDARAQLSDTAEIRWPMVEKALVSADGTVKFLLGLDDGSKVETVLIPEKDHFTQCLSTQVGCALGCRFCSTGTLGFTRNMTSGEILGQILVARRWLEEHEEPLRLRNLVFMGMGEPLLNFEALERSLHGLNSDLGLDFSTRRITVSTVGIVPKLQALGELALSSLAVSLHAPNQAIREQIMPKAARTPLAELMDELARYPIRNRESITFEYLLLGGINDEPEHARELIRLLSRVKAKINLIAYNASPGLPFKRPDPARVEAFQNVLRAKGFTATLRKSKGSDIKAACGQLAANPEE
ncbi:23S rRNA (adenine(2503)-C(2))-methyltransferase RlmN [Desulfovibrio inopinatus]|uniref:23S rRNA (adenine(2503)-C(2))-methyltransferase RlmN n=1 Tax=Desulfovibrio inopinatus TaxID=102109 RepID=UPI0004223A35|nr:23S rRNA (adenine(2503)-C(2))-methyltransferase RlmN [Desulfovibrio inopinatus]